MVMTVMEVVVMDLVVVIGMEEAAGMVRLSLYLLN